MKRRLDASQGSSSQTMVKKAKRSYNRSYRRPSQSFPQELNHIYRNEGGACDITGIILPLFEVDVGNTVNNRHGNKIQPWGIGGSLVSILNRTLGDNNNRLRYTIIQWYPDDSLDPPTLAKVYAATAHPTRSPYRQLKSDRKKFKVLMDQIVDINLQESGDKQINFYINLKRCVPIDFLSSTASNYTCTGQIYLIASSDSTTVTHPNYGLTSYLKLLP